MDIQITVSQRFPNVQMSRLRERGESRPTGIQKDFCSSNNSSHRRPLVIDEIDLNRGHLLRSISKMLRLS
jgi:hypothetical protein